MEQIAAAALAGELRNLLLPLDAGLDHIAATEVGEKGAALLRDGIALPVGMLDSAGQETAEGSPLRLHVHGAIAAFGRRTAFGAQPERVLMDCIEGICACSPRLSGLLGRQGSTACILASRHTPTC